MDSMKKSLKGTTLKILAAIAVGAALAYTYTGMQKGSTYAFIPNTAEGTISMIDTTVKAVVRTIDVGGKLPDGIALSRDGKLLYTGAAQEGNVYVIDTATGEKVKEIRTGRNVHGIDISPDGKSLYVASGDLKDGKEYDYISVIDTKRGEVVSTLTMDWKSPAHIDFSRKGDFVYVSNVMSNEVTILETSNGAVRWRIPVGNIPNETEPSKDGERLYVANVGDGTVSVIDLEEGKVTGVIEAGKGTHGLAVSSDDRYLWTANRTSGDVYVIEAESGSVVERISLGGSPNHISLSPDGKSMYVTNLEFGEVSVIDSATYQVVKVIPTGKEPHEMVFGTLRGQK
jgi:YVTN family beta-propeller protein